MPDAPTPLDLDAIREMLTDRRTLGRSAALDLIHEVEVQRILIDALREGVRILQATRPAPAWGEEVVVEAVATALHGDGCPEDPDEGESCACSDYLREARIAVAVVREHLPVKPGREDIYRAWHGTDDPWAGCADSASVERVLDLLPGRTEAEVKAEALREAADAVTEIDGRADDAAARWLRARADRLAAEGGADRG